MNFRDVRVRPEVLAANAEDPRQRPSRVQRTSSLFRFRRDGVRVTGNIGVLIFIQSPN